MVPEGKVWSPRRPVAGTAFVMSPRSRGVSHGQGVYKHRSGNKVYVGISGDVDGRVKQEARAIKNGKGMNPRFTRALSGVASPRAVRTQVDPHPDLSRGALLAREAQKIMQIRQTPTLENLNNTIIPGGTDRSELMRYLGENIMELRLLIDDAEALPEEDSLKAETLRSLQALDQ
jgi:hypothetical protein